VVDEEDLAGQIEADDFAADVVNGSRIGILGGSGNSFGFGA